MMRTYPAFSAFLRLSPLSTYTVHFCCWPFDFFLFFLSDFGIMQGVSGTWKGGVLISVEFCIIPGHGFISIVLQRWMSPYNTHTHEELLHHNFRACDGVMGPGEKNKRKKKFGGQRPSLPCQCVFLFWFSSIAQLFFFFLYLSTPFLRCTPVFLTLSFFLSFLLLLARYGISGDYRQTLWMASVCKWFTSSSIQKISAGKRSIIILPWGIRSNIITIVSLAHYFSFLVLYFPAISVPHRLMRVVVVVPIS